jgi:AraC family transcriptional regulator of adaptative response/methylated-DNA-[protein]-cysteine methyltransferase
MPYSTKEYDLISEAIWFLTEHADEQLFLEQIARKFGISEFYFQRLFSRWVGISPKRFLQFIQKENAKKLLADSQSVLQTSMDLGFSSPSRLHDLFVQCDAVTPGEWSYEGEGLTIRYGFHSTQFGLSLLGLTERGVCHLTFLKPNEKNIYLQELIELWPRANIIIDQTTTAATIELIFNNKTHCNEPLYVLLKGTNFQIKVWEALLKIPIGALSSYSDLALSIDSPTASRAVGTAIGANKIGYLIPCHRVIQKNGQFGHYRWDDTRKKIMLARESAYDLS